MSSIPPSFIDNYHLVEQLPVHSPSVEYWRAVRDQDVAEIFILSRDAAERIQEIPQGMGFSTLEIFEFEDQIAVIVPGILKATTGSIRQQYGPRKSACFAWHISDLLSVLHQSGRSHNLLHSDFIGINQRGELEIRPAIGALIPSEPDEVANSVATDCWQMGFVLKSLGITDDLDSRLMLLTNGLQQDLARLRVQPATAIRQSLSAVLARHPDWEDKFVSDLGKAWALNQRTMKEETIIPHRLESPPKVVPNIRRESADMIDLWGNPFSSTTFEEASSGQALLREAFATQRKPNKPSKILLPEPLDNLIEEPATLQIDLPNNALQIPIQRESVSEDGAANALVSIQEVGLETETEPMSRRVTTAAIETVSLEIHPAASVLDDSTIQPVSIVEEWDPSQVPENDGSKPAIQISLSSVTEEQPSTTLSVELRLGDEPGVEPTTLYTDEVDYVPLSTDDPIFEEALILESVESTIEEPLGDVESPNAEPQKMEVVSKEQSFEEAPELISEESLEETPEIISERLDSVVLDLNAQSSNFIDEENSEEFDSEEVTVAVVSIGQVPLVRIVEEDSFHENPELPEESEESEEQTGAVISLADSIVEEPDSYEYYEDSKILGGEQSGFVADLDPMNLEMVGSELDVEEPLAVVEFPSIEEVQKQDSSISGELNELFDEPTVEPSYVANRSSGIQEAEEPKWTGSTAFDNLSNSEDALGDEKYNTAHVEMGDVDAVLSQSIRDYSDVEKQGSVWGVLLVATLVVGAGILYLINPSSESSESVEPVSNLSMTGNPVEALPGPSLVDIKTNPPQGRIYIDKTEVGVAPAQWKLKDGQVFTMCVDWGSISNPICRRVPRTELEGGYTFEQVLTP